ncbi:ribonuclease H family protein [Parasporobacterium paucivorans]|uniref:Ribonuclease H n=1 Tax=Parasporobacterium paucivorans DSM 15970 TaxID=1122934 RepID=A0A1M6H6R5_9FIRM|nr:ribonuclease H family protein [Parasporobacterium paucivorans]SHJ17917.1 ribonuclease HI [Parasporobacterium paucivorans DSM 15970]
MKPYHIHVQERKHKMADKFYAVRSGRKPGIYRTWKDCEAQVHGCAGAQYKSYKTLEEAEVFMKSGPIQTSKPRTRTTNTKVSDSSVPDAPVEMPSGADCAVAYVDGSYNAATQEYSYGMVLFHDGEELHFSQMGNDAELALMRNVSGEIKGSEAAMQYAMDNGIKELTIYHDYEGISKWCLGEWKTNKEGTRAYKDFYDRAKTKVHIKFVKVAGHSGDKYNDLADRLAKQALFKSP